MSHTELLFAIAMILAAVLIIWQILYTFTKSRISLKHDLEILNLLPPNSDYADKLRKRVDERLKKNYGDSKQASWAGFALAASIFVFFAVVTSVNFTGDRLVVAWVCAGLSLLCLLSAICQLSVND